MITLYTIDCHNCKRLEDKLNDCGISYDVCKDKSKMAELGMTAMPVLQIDDDSFLSFKEAIKWANDKKMGD